MEYGGKFSIYGKKIVVLIDGVEHDISDKIPDWIWRYETKGNDINLNNPVVNWKIRTELAKATRKIVEEITGSDNVQIQM
jgi:hypothetical protein